MLKQQKVKSGFTIIEVVLVLAIAGLIFLMVFLALPNLQRSQRDTQRRDDLARLQTAITNYQSNNRGKLPGAGSTDPTQLKNKYNEFIENYLRVNGDTFDDPDGQPYYVGGVCVDFNKKSGNCDNSDELDQTFGEGDNMGSETIDNTQTNVHYIYVFQNATCDGETITASTGTRKVAFLYKMEGGGWYCGNN